MHKIHARRLIFPYCSQRKWHIEMIFLGRHVRREKRDQRDKNGKTANLKIKNFEKKKLAYIHRNIHVPNEICFPRN